tara:strand:+ start:2544 stop:2780 length:237 start_codon:yes stop_codon:yes gene_type:complete
MSNKLMNNYINFISNLNKDDIYIKLSSDNRKNIKLLENNMSDINKLLELNEQIHKILLEYHQNTVVDIIHERRKERLN